MLATQTFVLLALVLQAGSVFFRGYSGVCGPGMLGDGMHVTHLPNLVQY
jgi:hypothetical protein